MVTRLGIDFDNTIVCYDALFHRVAHDQHLIPAELQSSKAAIRDYLRAAGLEIRWTAMQGEVYGKRMNEAHAFPGVFEFLAILIRLQIPVFIVSHKTRFPYLGPKYDLHQAALAWLERQGVFDPMGVGLSRENVYLELTKQEKLCRIRALGCTHFVDDLPEVLGDKGFPSGVKQLLFDPNNQHSDVSNCERLRSWRQASVGMFLS